MANTTERRKKTEGKDSTNEKVVQEGGGVDICPVKPVLEGGDIDGRGDPWGANMAPSLVITSSTRLLRRNIKIHLDITQVFIMAYQIPLCLIALYTHLNMDTHFWTHCSHSNIRAGGRR